jgi:hypothetical protein
LLWVRHHSNTLSDKIVLPKEMLFHTHSKNTQTQAQQQNTAPVLYMGPYTGLSMLIPRFLKQNRPFHWKRFKTLVASPPRPFVKLCNNEAQVCAISNVLKTRLHTKSTLVVVVA